MRQLKTIRIFLTVLLFVATVAYLAIGPQVHPMAVVSEKVQVIPSALTITIGATLVWLVLTFLFGRVYCSSVCPVGTLQDFAIRLRRYIPAFKNRKYSFKQPKKWRYHILVVYLVCLVIGLWAVPYLIEPWNIMRNIAATVRPDAVEATWIHLGLGAATGMAAGAVSFLLIFLCSLFFGRDFCNTVCPLGNAMSLLSDQTLYSIEIDPDKCIGCLECENVCKASCVKVVSRYVDNSRCVRCFDCLAVCPNDAIRFQATKNRPATPLFRRKKTT